MDTWIVIITKTRQYGMAVASQWRHNRAMAESLNLATSVSPTWFSSQRVCGMICSVLRQSEGRFWPLLGMLGTTWRRGVDITSVILCSSVSTCAIHRSYLACCLRAYVIFNAYHNLTTVTVALPFCLVSRPTLLLFRMTRLCPGSAPVSVFVSSLISLDTDATRVRWFKATKKTVARCRHA